MSPFDACCLMHQLAVQTTQKHNHMVSLSRLPFDFIFTSSLTYTTLVIAKSSLDALLPSLVHASNSILKDNEQAAQIVSLGHIGYFVSKIFSGWLLDCEMLHSMSRNYFMLSVVFFACSVTLLLMCLASNAFLFSLGWFLFRSVAATVWVILTRLVYGRFGQTPLSVVTWSFLSIGSRTGQLVGITIFSTLLLLSFSWRMVLVTGASLLACSSVWNGYLSYAEKKRELLSNYFRICTASSEEQRENLVADDQGSLGLDNDETVEDVESVRDMQTPKYCPPRRIGDTSPSSPNNDDDASSTDTAIMPCPVSPPSQTAAQIFLSPKLWAMILASTGTSVLFEINSFYPIYLLNHQNMRHGNAALASIPLYFASLLSLVLTSLVYDQLNVMMRSSYILFSLASALACFVTLSVFPDQPFVCTVFLVFIIGFSLTPVYYLPSNTFSIMHGGKSSCARVSALMDAVSFGCTAMFDIAVIGPLIRDDNWSSYFHVSAAVCAASMLAFLLFFWMK